MGRIGNSRTRPKHYTERLTNMSPFALYKIRKLFVNILNLCEVGMYRHCPTSNLM